MLDVLVDVDEEKANGIRSAFKAKRTPHESL